LCIEMGLLPHHLHRGNEVKPRESISVYSIPERFFFQKRSSTGRCLSASRTRRVVVVCGVQVTRSPLKAALSVWNVLYRVHSALNTTLGLGSNRIALILQDTATGSTLNTYLLTLHRYKADRGEPRFDSNTAYAVCGLRQVRLRMCCVRCQGWPVYGTTCVACLRFLFGDLSNRLLINMSTKQSFRS
jgi:hypothetical protein